MTDKITELLRSLVEIRSSYPNEKELADYIFTFLSNQNDISVDKQVVGGDRFNIIATRGTGTKSIAFYAHLDTINVVDGWKRDPFKLTIEGDRAYGLGSYDMKGGMVANIITFLETDILEDYYFKLILCVDEEYISKGGYAVANSDFVNDVECIFSPEPAFKYGLNGITIGRVGRSVFEIELNRDSAHYNFYSPDKDLNILASKIIQNINYATYNEQSSDERQFVYVRNYVSSSVGMSVPQKVLIELDSSIIPPMNTEEMISLIENIIKTEISNFDSSINYEVRAKSRVTPFLQPYRIEKDNNYLEKLKRAVNNITGEEAKPYFRSSVGDDNIFGALGHTLLGIGPTGDNAHAPDEWVSISSIEKLIEVYIEFLNQL
ncbi:MAG: M20/M25/M40 family metallo-hydrolase [Candidatus Dojkabacteria bacterium]|nr:M20/M25/M40 family metallo-hydrolase [Candidatus Dojkabacteria bacterium]MDQ7021262.1 M20/M25/M40 family metallo-hydrolase [Candidatus Dojkabacteria bacterium]